MEVFQRASRFSIGSAVFGGLTDYIAIAEMSRAVEEVGQFFCSYSHLSEKAFSAHHKFTRKTSPGVTQTIMQQFKPTVVVVTVLLISSVRLAAIISRVATINTSDVAYPICLPDCHAHCGKTADWLCMNAVWNGGLAGGVDRPTARSSFEGGGGKSHCNEWGRIFV